MTSSIKTESGVDATLPGEWHRALLKAKVRNGEWLRPKAAAHARANPRMQNRCPDSALCCQDSSAQWRTFAAPIANPRRASI